MTTRTGNAALKANATFTEVRLPSIPLSTTTSTKNAAFANEITSSRHAPPLSKSGAALRLIKESVTVLLETSSQSSDSSAIPPPTLLLRFWESFRSKLHLAVISFRKPNNPSNQGRIRILFTI